MGSGGGGDEEVGEEGESVWPSGKAVGPRFDTASALLSLQKLWFVDTVL